MADTPFQLSVKARLNLMSGEQLTDMFALLNELWDCDDPKVFMEIMDVAKELIFPETIGELKFGKMPPPPANGAEE